MMKPEVFPILQNGSRSSCFDVVFAEHTRRNSNITGCLITELLLNGGVCSLEIRIGRLPRRPIMFTDVGYIHAEVYLCDLITLRQLTGNPLSE